MTTEQNAGRSFVDATPVLAPLMAAMVENRGPKFAQVAEAIFNMRAVASAALRSATSKEEEQVYERCLDRNHSLLCHLAEVDPEQVQASIIEMIEVMDKQRAAQNDELIRALAEHAQKDEPEVNGGTDAPQVPV